MFYSSCSTSEMQREREGRKWRGGGGEKRRGAEEEKGEGQKGEGERGRGGEGREEEVAKDPWTSWLIRNSKFEFNIFVE